MSKEREKYLKKLSPKQFHKIMGILKRIGSGDTSELDIKRLENTKDLWRCRVGNLRILFEKKLGTVTIKKIGPRGDVYK